MPKRPLVLAYHECCLLRVLCKDPVCRKVKEESGIQGGIKLMGVKPKEGGRVGELVITTAEGSGLCEKEVQVSEEVIRELLAKVLLWTAGGKCNGCCPDSKSNHCLQGLGRARGLFIPP